MDEKDLEVIINLMNKAVNSNRYMVAEKLRCARDELKKSINNDWAKDIIQKIQ